MTTYTIQPISRDRAFAFIDTYHRHHRHPQGWKFGVALADLDGAEVAVACAGRPVARYLDDGTTLEITRVCSIGVANACSQLYGALRRAAFALGYCRVITYTLATEPGTSLRAAGFTLVHTQSQGQSWYPGGENLGPKVMWESRNLRSK